VGRVNLRRIASTAFTLTLAAGALLVAPTDAHPAGPVTSGNGWKIGAPRITHIDSKPWVIAFHDSTSRTKLTPYLRHTAAELTERLGVQVTVTTRIVPASRTTCTRGHVITYRYMSKPNPDRPNQSFAVVCGNSRQAADGASIYINSDYWSPTRRFRESTRMNVIWHESAHAVGLTHPDTCPTNADGRRPLMCADQPTDLRTRRYSPYETAGFRRLIANRIYYSPYAPQ
jgi:hypothetical protein